MNDPPKEHLTQSYAHRLQPSYDPSKITSLKHENVTTQDNTYYNNYQQSIPKNERGYQEEKLHEYGMPNEYVPSITLPQIHNYSSYATKDPRKLREKTEFEIKDRYLADSLGQLQIKDDRQDIQHAETVKVLDEYVITDKILMKEMNPMVPNVLQPNYFKQLTQIHRKVKSGVNPTIKPTFLFDSTPSHYCSNDKHSSIEYLGREHRVSRECFSNVYLYSPLNNIEPPTAIVDFKSKNATSGSKGKSNSGSFFSSLKSPPPQLPNMNESLKIPASSFFETYEIKNIGPFVLTKTLGAGSTGKVKLAVHERTGEKIAIKIIPRDSPPPPPEGDQINDISPVSGETKTKRKKSAYECNMAKEARLLREISILSLLQHPHIVTLYGYTVTAAYYVLFMEYVEGGPLLHYILNHGKLREKHAREFFRQLLSAISYCHENSIVHRDLKIENILLDRDGNIKLIDFGLSNFFHEATSTWDDFPVDPLKLTTFCGSLYYAAPELLHGRPYYGPEIDIWSIGVILFVLTVGKVPFDDSELPKLHEKIKRGKVIYPSFLSEELIELLKLMLCVSPQERSTLDILLHADWTNITYDTVTPPSSTQATQLPAKRAPRQLQLIKSYVPSRVKPVEIHRSVVFGLCLVLGRKYSPYLLMRVLEHALNDWTAMRKHPIVLLYYLVSEKYARWLETVPAPPLLDEDDIGLHRLGTVYSDADKFPGGMISTDSLLISQPFSPRSGYRSHRNQLSRFNGSLLTNIRRRHSAASEELNTVSQIDKPSASSNRSWLRSFLPSILQQFFLRKSSTSLNKYGESSTNASISDKPFGHSPVNHPSNISYRELPSVGNRSSISNAHQRGSLNQPSRESTVARHNFSAGSDNGSSNSRSSRVSNELSSALMIRSISKENIPDFVYIVQPDLSLSAPSLQVRPKAPVTQGRFGVYDLYENSADLRHDLIKSLNFLGLPWVTSEYGVICTYTPSVERVLDEAGIKSDILSDYDPNEKVRESSPLSSSFIRCLQIDCDIMCLNWTDEYVLHFSIRDVQPVVKQVYSRALFLKLIQEIVKATCYFCNERLKHL